MNDKNFERINIKFEIRIWQYTQVPNFSHFGERQFLGPNLPKKALYGGILGQMQPENNLI